MLYLSLDERIQNKISKNPIQKAIEVSGLDQALNMQNNWKFNGCANNSEEKNQSQMNFSCLGIWASRW